MKTKARCAAWSAASVRAKITAALCFALAGMGCAAIQSPASSAYMLAVRYDVEPVYIGVDRSRGNERIKTDLRRASELGFDAVVFEYVEDERRVELLEAASRCGLVATVPDRDVRHYLLTDRLPRGCTSPEALLRAKTRGLSKVGGFGGLSIGRLVRTDDAGGRLDRTLAAAAKTGVRCVSLDGSSALGRGGTGFAVVDAGDIAGDTVGSPLERLLAQYHGELAAGRTGGLVVDRFSRPPGERAGVAAVDDSPSAAKLAAMQGLLGRARRWGNRLCGFRSEVLKDGTADGGGVSLIGFAQARRRYVLAYNPSRDQYVRRPVAVPATVGGRAADRLVEVLATAERVAGEVLEAQRGGAIIQVDLRPGDAVLFEVF